MGLRFRKRIGGKNGWFNLSWSGKNGFGLSTSVKAGPFTLNSGNGKTTKGRLTTNLPGGFYHVSESTSSPKNKTPAVKQIDKSDDNYLWLQIIAIGAILLAGTTLALWGLAMFGMFLGKLIH